MPGFIKDGDSGSGVDRDLRNFAIDRVREMLQDGFGDAYQAAKAMVVKLNIEVAKAKETKDKSFRDIRTFAKPLGGYWYLTGPFEVAVLDTNTGPRISILGNEIDPAKIYEERVDQDKIKFEDSAKRTYTFLDSLKRNQLPIGNGGLFRGQLKIDWGKKAGQNFEVGGMGSKDVSGVRDITKEVEALLA